MPARCDYRCWECGHEIRLSQSGVRTLHACTTCEAVQRFERVQSPEEARP